MAKTKVDVELEAAEAHFGDDPERQEVIARTRRFKSSWIELAEALTRAQRSSSWRRWGFASFEDYTRVELHLRNETVCKLTGSFLFLKQKAPDVLARDGVSAPLPSYQSVDFWRQAETEGNAKSDVLDAIRERVVGDCASLPSITKEFAAEVFPIDKAERQRKQSQSLAQAAGRVQTLLGESELVPKSFAREVDRVLGELIERLEMRNNRAA